VTSTLEGQTLFRDALRMLGVKKRTTFQSDQWPLYDFSRDGDQAVPGFRQHRRNVAASANGVRSCSNTCSRWQDEHTVREIAPLPSEAMRSLHTLLKCTAASGIIYKRTL